MILEIQDVLLEPDGRETGNEEINKAGEAIHKDWQETC